MNSGWFHCAAGDVGGERGGAAASAPLPFDHAFTQLVATLEEGIKVDEVNGERIVAILCPVLK